MSRSKHPHADEEPYRPRAQEQFNEGLFADAPLRAPASHQNPQSLAAAAAVLPKQASRAAQVLAHLVAYGPSTSDQIEERTGWPHQGVGPRLLDLIHAGLVVRTGRTRPTRSGQQAALYEATPLAITKLAEERNP